MIAGMKHKSKLRIIILAVTACFLWSTAFAAVKIGLKFSGPFFFAGLRFMLAGVMLIPFCGRPADFYKSITSNIRLILFVSFFQIIILYGIFFYALTFMSGALVAIMIGSSPLVTAVTSHFLMKDDEMNLPKTLSLLIGVIGIIILSFDRKPWTGEGLKELFGIILLIIGNISSGLGNIIVARWSRMDPYRLNSSQIFIGGLVLFAASLFFEGAPSMAYPMEFIIALLWLAFLSAAAFSIWFILLKTPGVKVSELNVWKFVVPIFGAGLSWLILPDESPELMQVAGMIFIVLSIILFNLTVMRRNGKSTRGLFLNNG